MFADIHTHLLPGVDDGCPDLTSSLNSLRDLAKQGVRDVALTPHIHWYFSPETNPDYQTLIAARGWGQGGPDPLTFVPQKFPVLQQAAKDAGLDVQLHQGGELHPSVAAQQTAESLATIALGPTDKQWVLLEVDLIEDFGPAWSDAANKVRSHGYEVVIAHPERSPNMASLSARDRLRQEVAQGVQVQVNVSSLLYHGSNHQRLALELIAEGLVTAVASDMHPPRRPHPVTALLAQAQQIGLSEQEVKQLIGVGPRTLLRG